MSPALCPCHSTKPFSKCCQPLLNGQMKARTVTQLMRSRYCAYALGGYGDYLYRTWLPRSRGRLTAEDLDHASVAWTRLHVLDSRQQGNTGEVEFIANFIEDDGSEGVHHERSTFIREQGHWLYCEGEVNAGPATRANSLKA